MRIDKGSFLLVKGAGITMSTMTQERIRITFDVPDRVRRALNIAAAETNETVGEIIERMTGELLQEQLSRADEIIAKGVQSPKRGRRPKFD